MDTQIKNETSAGTLPKYIMLADKAETEMMKNGAISTTCPKCGKKPKIWMTLKDKTFEVPDGDYFRDNAIFAQRIKIRCECGYIRSGEICL